MSQAAQRARPESPDLDWYRTMRDEHPVWQDPDTGIWTVFRYRDVAAVLADHKSFSNDIASLFPERSVSEGNILTMDPPRHDRMRALVSKAFTPRTVADLEARTADLATELLDQIGDRTDIELVRELAYPLPVIVIAELLGVPPEDRARFQEWADALFAQGTVEPDDEAGIASLVAKLTPFREYLGAHIEARRDGDHRDLLADLVVAEIDGRRLGDEELIGFATFLLLAGHITTTLAIGNAILCLDEHPEAQEALRARPDAIPLAIEEVLRYRTPLNRTVPRVTTAEVTIGEQTIGPRQLVDFSLLSANHDERQFERPDAFVVDRQPNPHLSFGRGIHACLGAPLARLETKVTLGLLLRRYDSIRLDPQRPPVPHADTDLPGVQTQLGMRTMHVLVRPTDS
jgi:cytochrome P450